MKSILFLIGILLSFSFSSKPLSNKNLITVSSTSNIVTLSAINSDNTFNKITPTESKVYICGGKYAKKFHSRDNCRGLNNCKSAIYSYNSQQTAINNGYEYCLICWK